MLRPRLVHLSFIVTRAYQKIKVLFCRISFDYTTNSVKKCFVFLLPFLFFVFLRIKKRKEKYRVNSIMLQNLL